MVWSGSWVAERLGVELVGDGKPDGDRELKDLLGLALRRNPKRAHLLVSNVLGKHVPQKPSVVYGTGFELGRRVRELLGDAEARRAVVLGYAETATGLGHAVADGLGVAPYLHSTRRPVEGVARAGGFEEFHSHATSHLLLPEDPDLLAGDLGPAPLPGAVSDAPLVLVDDEFSTGNTVLNTIRALHERYPRSRYVIVALVDMRSCGRPGAADRVRRGDRRPRRPGGARLGHGNPPGGRPGEGPGTGRRTRVAGRFRSRRRSGAQALHPGGSPLARRCAGRRTARLHPRPPGRPGTRAPRHGRPDSRSPGRRPPRTGPRLRGADVRPPASGHGPGGPHRRRGALLHHHPFPRPRRGRPGLRDTDPAGVPGPRRPGRRAR